MDEKERREAERRLLSPLSVVNWVRHNRRRLDDTAKRLYNFALRPPRHNLTPVNRICAGIATKRLSLDEALAKVEALQSPITRIAGREVVPAFFNIAERKGFDAIPDIGLTNFPYPIARGPDGGTLTVPVRPTFVLLEGDKLVPVFLITWASLSIDGFQKQLLSTIICKSLLTQQDFLSSDALILAIPRNKWKAREERSWYARPYGTLSDDEMLAQFERYGSALTHVLNRLRSM